MERFRILRRGKMWYLENAITGEQKSLFTRDNPNSPERDVPIPSRAVVKFKAGKELKSKVMALKFP